MDDKVKRSGPNDVHVIPNNDLREHEPTSECFCQPTEEEPGLWVHHSLDRRELYETGEIKPQ